MTQRHFGSLTRISDLADVSFEVGPLDRAHWATGDYVEGEVIGTASELYRVEDPQGVMHPVGVGDRVVGALGDRAATLEGVGNWRGIEDGRMQALTSAGLFGRFTSISTFMAAPMELAYRGHVLRGGEKVAMGDFALAADGADFAVPTVLLFGTSMSAGKTTTGQRVCEYLAGRGCRVIGAKLTGAGRYRDVVSFRTAGAAQVFDFVDVGLPSTVVPEAEFRERIRVLLRHIAGCRPDVLVAEAGASPLEPYNGATAIEELGDNLRCRILCASDPYAVLGVRHAFGVTPDLVAGPAASTSAAIDLVANLADVRGINILDPASAGAFHEALDEALGLPPQ